MESMIERVAEAIERAEFGYEMNLVSLVDGVSTYRLRYDDGETLEFGSTDEVYSHVADKRRSRQARAAIEAMLTPTDAMIDMMYDADNDGEVEHAYRSAVRAALNEQVAG